jgi:hypothetical protein
MYPEKRIYKVQRNPMTEAEHAAKFRDGAAQALGAAGVAAAEVLLAGLAEGGMARALVDALVGAGGEFAGTLDQVGHGAGRALGRNRCILNRRARPTLRPP